MSFLTGTNTELIYASTAAGTAKNTFTTEVGINDTTAMGVQAHIPPDFWLPNQNQAGRGIKISARGIISTFTSGTFTFTIRLGAAGNVASTPIVLGSSALVMTVSQTNVPFFLEGEFFLKTIGAAGGNSTFTGVGWLHSPAIATPFVANLYGAAATPGTVATVDTTITNYINFNVACSVSNAANGVTLQSLQVYGLN